MELQLRSYQTILGGMVSKLLAETDLTDISPGSVLLTILEAAASSDFTSEGKLLQLLNLRNIDKTTGTDLEDLATEFGLSPSRLGASSAKAKLTISETAFSKIATTIFAGSINPISGDTKLKLSDASDFPSSGTIYIGRGGSNSEYVNYVSKTENGTYWELALASPLTKDHLVNEEIVLGQGGDRSISAGTTVKAPGASGTPSIEFTIQQNVVLADGEDSVSGVEATASTPGSQANVAINRLIEFSSLPWSTAAVTNPSSATGGRDAETDAELRQRIKDRVHELGRGTERAIKRSVHGVTDPDEQKSVVSAFYRSPINSNDLGVLFIDDGTGFAPSFAGIGQETIITNATGSEKFIQLQQFPLVKAQCASVNSEPFGLIGGEKLLVEVDGTTEEQSIPATFNSPGQVTAQELSEAINSVFSTIEARAKNGKLFLTPVANDPDYIRVGSASSNDANDYIKFPTRKTYTLKLYKNEKPLNKNGSEAIIQSFPNNAWPVFSSTETLQLKIDGIDSPVVSFRDLEFSTYTSSPNTISASPSDWATLINLKFIGVTAEGKDDGTFTIKSNRDRSSKASIAVIGGTLSGRIISESASATGAESEFKLNRFLGQIELSSKLSSGDQLKAGTINTEGFVDTSAQTPFNLPATLGAPAKLVVVADYPAEIIPIAATTFNFTAESGFQRITGLPGQFSKVAPDDWVHLYNMPRNGLFKVYFVEDNGNYIDLWDPSPVTGAATADTTRQLTIFRTKSIPQEVTLPVGSDVESSSIVDVFNSSVTGAVAEVLDSGAIRFMTKRLSGVCAISMPAICGSATYLGLTAGTYTSNDPHIATVESSDLVGIPSGRLRVATNDLVSPYTELNTIESLGSENNNRQIVQYLGASGGIVGQPAIMNDLNTITLRDQAPKRVVGIGSDLRAASAPGCEFGQADNMVFIVDDDASKKTFDIPMYVDGEIVGPTTPSRTQFDAKDSSGAMFGSDARWLDYPFEDYKVWFKSRGDLPSSETNSRIRITSALFGPNGKTLRVGIKYPTSALSPAIAKYSVDATNQQTLIDIHLASDAARTIGLLPNSKIWVSADGKVRFSPSVSLSMVQIGDILNLKDSAFSQANQGPARITEISNYNDARTFTHLTETLSKGMVLGQTLMLNAAPSQLVQVGDKLTFTSITKTITAMDSTSVTVASGGRFSSSGEFMINGTAVSYSSYSAGVFSGLSLDPTTIGSVGSELTQSISFSATVTSVASQTEVSISLASLEGDGYDFSIEHSAITLDSAPSFVVSVGDKIHAAGQILSVTGVISSTIVNVDAPFVFSGSQGGSISRLVLSTSRTGVAEEISSSASDSVEVFGLDPAQNTASSIIDVINNTAGVNGLIVASNASGSDGSGSLAKSTADESGNERISLQNSSSWIYATSATSPIFTLKTNLDVAPEIGEKFRLIPVTPKNVVDHFSKKQICGLSIAADIELVEDGRKAQISSKVPGGIGQVYAVGGRASGNVPSSLIGAGLQISSSIGQIEIESSAKETLAPGHMVYLSQSGSAKKRFVGASPSSSTQLQIEKTGPVAGKLTFGVALAKTYSYVHNGTVVWATRKLGKGRMRFELVAGTATLPAELRADDWVLIGDGSSYMGISPSIFFSSSNRGYFQVRETDNQTYFDIDLVGTEEFVSASSTPFIFAPYHAARPGDKIQIDGTSPLSVGNRGTFTITSVLSQSVVEFTNSNVADEGPVALGEFGTNSLAVLDQGFSTYRKVVLVAPSQADPANRTTVILEPGYDISLFTEGRHAMLSTPNRLGFSKDPVPGMSGYQFWTGLKRRVQRTVDGFEPDTTTFPGVRAAGVSIEVREPQIQRVSIVAKIKTNEGVSLAAIADSIRSNVIGFINSLGLGQDVILSEVVSLIQNTSGVDAVVLVDPVLDQERIVIADSAIPRTSASEITLS